jgi:hypothetical protein
MKTIFFILQFLYLNFAQASQINNTIIFELTNIHGGNWSELVGQYGTEEIKNNLVHIINTKGNLNIDQFKGLERQLYEIALDNVGRFISLSPQTGDLLKRDQDFFSTLINNNDAPLYLVASSLAQTGSLWAADKLLSLIEKKQVNAGEMDSLIKSFLFLLGEESRQQIKSDASISVYNINTSLPYLQREHAEQWDSLVENYSELVANESIYPKELGAKVLSRLERIKNQPKITKSEINTTSPTITMDQENHPLRMRSPAAERKIATISKTSNDSSSEDTKLLILLLVMVTGLVMIFLLNKRKK